MIRFLPKAFSNRFTRIAPGLVTWMYRIAVALWTIAAVWFLLMAIFPGAFPFHSGPGLVFTVGLGIAVAATPLKNDEFWPTDVNNADWPIEGSATYVDLSETNDD